MATAVEQRGSAIVRRLPPKAKVAEVGVLLAKLSEYILTHSDAEMILVDSWAPGSEQPDHYKATRDAHSNIDAGRAGARRREAESRVARFGNRANIVCGWSTNVARNVPDGSLDMIFLDADHSYAGVRADIEAWLPKVRDGGWIGGHDYQNDMPEYDFSGVQRAVDEAFPEGVELDGNYTWFCRVG